MQYYENTVKEQKKNQQRIQVLLCMHNWLMFWEKKINLFNNQLQISSICFGVMEHVSTYLFLLVFCHLTND